MISQLFAACSQGPCFLNDNKYYRKKTFVPRWFKFHFIVICNLPSVVANKELIQAFPLVTCLYNLGKFSPPHTIKTRSFTTSTSALHLKPDLRTPCSTPDSAPHCVRTQQTTRSIYPSHDIWGCFQSGCFLLLLCKTDILFSKVSLRNTAEMIIMWVCI